jgi:hypothetical protein
MIVVIAIKAASPHHPIKYIECHHQYDCSMPNVLKLSSRNLPWSYRLRWCASFYCLNVRFLVNTDYYFASLMKPRNSLVTPQDLRRSLGELFVYCGGLPIAPAMRLQAGRLKYARNRSVVNPFNYGLLNDNLLERAAIPTSQMAPIGSRIGAGDPFNFDPLDRGKKRGAVRYARHQRWPRHLAQGIAATIPKGRCDLCPAIELSQRSVRRDLKPKEHVLGWRLAESVGRHLLFPASNGDLFRSVCILLDCVLSSYSIPFREESYVDESSEINLFGNFFYNPLVVERSTGCAE